MAGKKPTYTVIYIAYYFTLAAYLVASYFPEHRVWGFNWWAHYPDWVRWALFGLGGLVPVVLRFIGWDEKSSSDNGTKTASGDRKFFIYVGVIAAAFGGLFYLLRARTHFLGDGYTLLSELAADSPFAMKTREYGEALSHILLKRVIGGDGQAAALLSHQIISITAGLLFVVVVSLFARKLYERTADRVLFLLGVCTGGYMLLFFGYVENYSLFVLSVLTYTLTGLLIAQGKASRYWLLPPLMASAFFHVLGVTLIPSALYLWVGPSRLGRTIRGWKLLTKLIALVPIVAVAGGVFYHFYTTDYFFRFAFVPLIENRFTVEGYTMFSTNHLVDFLNLLFLLVPGLLVVIVSLSGRSVKSALKQRPFIYLAILTSCVLGAVFIFDPKLGMPRDWDLFSFAGVPVVVLLNSCLLDSGDRWRVHTRVILLCLALGVVSLLPRAFAQIVPRMAVSHLLQYRDLDACKCRNAQALLVEYSKQSGDEWVERIKLEHWDGTYEQEDLFDRGIAAMNVGDYTSAVSAFKRACQIDPMYWNSWATLGGCLGQLGMTDAALTALDIAEGINPHGAAIFNNRGAVLTRLGKYREAENMFLKSLKFDTSNIGPLAGLVTIYRSTKQESQYRKYLTLAASRPDAPGGLIGELGYYLLAKHQFQAAAEAFKVALAKGLDSSYVQGLLEKNPELKEHMTTGP